MPRLSRGLHSHNGRGAHGALAHMENVPPGVLAGALRDRPRTLRLLGCRPGRHGGAPRSRVPLPMPWGILQLVHRHLASFVTCSSLRILSLRSFDPPLSFLFPPPLLVRAALTSAYSPPLYLPPPCCVHSACSSTFLDLLTWVARYPLAWSFAPYSCRPFSLHWLLVTPSQILSPDLVCPLLPTPLPSRC